MTSISRARQAWRCLALCTFLALFAGSSLALPAGVTQGATVDGITEYTLANGLRVLLFPDPSRPKTTVNITYLVGSRMENYGETGMAHLLEHMVFKGTPTSGNIMAALAQRVKPTDLDFRMLGKAFGYQVCPEPSSLAIAGVASLGMVCFGLCRRRAHPGCVKSISRVRDTDARGTRTQLVFLYLISALLPFSPGICRI